MPEVSMPPHFKTLPDGVAIISNIASHWQKEQIWRICRQQLNILAGRWHIFTFILLLKCGGTIFIVQ